MVLDDEWPVFPTNIGQDVVIPRHAWRKHELRSEPNRTELYLHCRLYFGVFEYEYRVHFRLNVVL